MSEREESREAGRNKSDIGCGDFARTSNMAGRPELDLKTPPRILAKNTEESALKMSLTRSAGRKLCSKSMTNLMISWTDKDNNGSRRRKTQTTPKVLKMVQPEEPPPPCAVRYQGNSLRIKEAARRVQTVLLMNVWRRTRENCTTMQTSVVTLSSQMESLQMQIYVLRQLLDTEKTRVAVASEDIQKALNNLEECRNEKTKLLMEKEQLELRLNEFEDRINQLETKCLNQKNDLLIVRSESEKWEKQLEKEREKLKVREKEKKALKEEVQFRENLLLLQTRNLEQLSQSNKSLQAKLEAQVPLWDETMVQVDTARRKLEESEEQQVLQKYALNEKELDVRQMKIQISELEERLREQDERNGELGKNLQEKTDELSKVQQKLGELSEKHRSWTGRVIKVASICAKVPAACFYTLAILLLPIPPCKSF